MTAVQPVIEGWFTTGPEPALVGSSCSSCGTVAFPPRAGPCPNPRCDADELSDRPLARHGTIWSFTDAQYQPPPPFIARTEPYEPFALAAVELDGEGMVVLGQLADGFDVEHVDVGTRVVLVVEPLYEVAGTTHVVWKWKPVGESGGSDE